MVGGDKRQKEAWPYLGVLPPASENTVTLRCAGQGELNEQRPTLHTLRAVEGRGKMVTLGLE